MKAIIDSIEFNKEVDTKFGKRYSFKVKYNGKLGSFLAKDKDQTDFIIGQENEFTEEEKIYNDQVYYNIKPIPKSKQNGYAKAVKKEQSKYSGFSMSYAKDLVITGKIELKDMFTYSEKMFKSMVDLDKTLDQ